MTTYHAIETHYAGYRFRSRLEARWATFFTALDIRWEYEVQGFRVGASARPYLPDFYLPDQKAWVEVKGEVDKLDWQLMADCSFRGAPCLPDLASTIGTDRGLLILGPIPRATDFCKPVAHPILQADESGVWSGVGRFIAGGFQVEGVTGEPLADNATPNAAWTSSARERFTGEFTFTTLSPDPEVNWAYRAARTARFEHGERPGRPVWVGQRLDFGNPPPKPLRGPWLEALASFPEREHVGNILLNPESEFRMYADQVIRVGAGEFRWGIARCKEGYRTGVITVRGRMRSRWTDAIRVAACTAWNLSRLDCVSRGIIAPCECEGALSCTGETNTISPCLDGAHRDAMHQSVTCTTCSL